MNPAFHPNRSRRLIAAAVAAALALTALTGCVPKTPPIDPDTSTWFPLPTLPTGASTWYPPGWSSTPPTPALPTSTADPLYQEAVQVYQLFYREYTEAKMGGGATVLPEPLAENVTGEAATMIAGFLAKVKNEGIQYLEGAELNLRATAPYSQDAPDGTVVGMQTCEEVNATIVDAAGNELPTSGHTWYSYRVFFTRTADQRLVLSTYVNGSLKCPE